MGKVFGLIVVGGIAAMGLWLLIDRVWYRWGALAALLFFFLLLGGVSYYFDRKKQREYEALG